MKHKIILYCSLLLLLITSVSAQHRKKNDFGHVMGKIVDERDGQEYTTVTFTVEKHDGFSVTRTWLAENARYNVDGSVCYDNTSEYCNKFGRLYNYEQAQSACPEGYHLSTIKEWELLVKAYRGWHHAVPHLIDGGGSDMNILFAGYGVGGGKDGKGEYKKIGVGAYFWDNDLRDSAAGIISFEKGKNAISHTRAGDKYKMSCRCVKYHN